LVTFSAFDGDHLIALPNSRLVGRAAGGDRLDFDDVFPLAAKRQPQDGPLRRMVFTSPFGVFALGTA